MVRFTFEGNNHTISNLYIRAIGAQAAGSVEAGLFRSTGSDVKIENVRVSGVVYGSDNPNSDQIGVLVGIHRGRIVSSRASGSAYGGAGFGDAVGILVGVNRGVIVVSYANGSAYGGTGNKNQIGVLVGQNRGRIIASNADGTAQITSGNESRIGILVGENRGRVIASYSGGTVQGGGDQDHIGGLVGHNEGSGTTIGSYSTATVRGGGGNDRGGGLVGWNNGKIIASYATGDVHGENGTDHLGGLIGAQLSDATLRIIASYATGDVFGGEGAHDRVGAMAGAISANGYDSSHGFGAFHGEIEERKGFSSQMPSAAALTASTFGPSFNGAAFDTNLVWNLGSATQAPWLRYVDYDGLGNDYACTDFIPNILPNGDMITCYNTFLPGQPGR